VKENNNHSPPENCNKHLTLPKTTTPYRKQHNNPSSEPPPKQRNSSITTRNYNEEINHVKNQTPPLQTLPPNHYRIHHTIEKLNTNNGTSTRADRTIAKVAQKQPENLQTHAKNNPTISIRALPNHR
jgi:hypothetical protein